SGNPGHRVVEAIRHTRAFPPACCTEGWVSPLSLPSPRPARCGCRSSPSPLRAEPPATDPPAPTAAAPEPEPEPEPDTPVKTLKEQRLALFNAMETRLDLDASQLAAVEHIFEASPVLGQGNPAISRHGMTRSECHRKRVEAGLHLEEHPPCARKNMVPLYDPEAGETADDVRVCIDQFEFPDIACEYPVTHVTAREAALLCAAEGKRICDAHEWEGACAGALHSPDEEYDFSVPRPLATWRHNHDREIVWAYGPKKDHALCGTGMPKT